MLIAKCRITNVAERQVVLIQQQTFRVGYAYSCQFGQPVVHIGHKQQIVVFPMVVGVRGFVVVELTTGPPETTGFGFTVSMR